MEIIDATVVFGEPALLAMDAFACLGKDFLTGS
jgi:hypothetical protein